MHYKKPSIKNLGLFKSGNTSNNGVTVEVFCKLKGDSKNSY